MASYSAMVDLGNSILKTKNDIKFQSLPMPICMQFLFLFGFYSVLSLVNITDFMLWNIKGLILTESNLLLLSTWLGTETSSSLCISCMCLGQWIAVILMFIPWNSGIPL